MTKLSPDARDLLAEALSGERPPRGARDRVHARVLAHVGAGAAAGTAVALLAADAKAAAGAAGAGGSSGTGGAVGLAGSTVKAAASTSLLLKWATVVGLAGTMALGAGIARDRMAGPAPAPTTTGALATNPRASGSPLEAPPRDTPAAVAAPPSEVVASGAPSASVSVSAPAASPPPAVSVAGRRSAPFASASADVSPESALEAEAARLARAQAEIRAGRPGGALEMLDDHGGSAKDGVLGEERVGARILALCALGRKDEARAEGQRFLAAFPRSPVAERVRTSCAGEASPAEPSR